MMRICFSPDDRDWRRRAVPLSILIPTLPVSETCRVLSMKISLTMSLKMIMDSARS